MGRFTHSFKTLISVIFSSRRPIEYNIMRPELLFKPIFICVGTYWIASNYISWIVEEIKFRTSLKKMKEKRFQIISFIF
jgi:hypothetical protein